MEKSSFLSMNWGGGLVTPSHTSSNKASIKTMVLNFLWFSTNAVFAQIVVIIDAYASIFVSEQFCRSVFIDKTHTFCQDFAVARCCRCGFLCAGCVGIGCFIFYVFSNISKSEFSVVEMRDFGSFSFALRGLCAPPGSLNHPWEHYFDW